jgi:hypothetical protein
MTVSRATWIPWYENAWPSFHLCALVSRSPLYQSGLHLEYVNLQAYRLFLFTGPSEPFYLYTVQGDGCP